MGRKTKMYQNNYKFLDSAYLNNQTYLDYLNRFKKVALSIFEWVNLPETMNAQAIERDLYFNGQCAFLKDENYGFINTKCCSNGKINIYGFPTNLNCYSYDYQTSRKLFVAKNENFNEYDECILVQNDWERTPTAQTLELFALRLYEVERTIDVNIKAQKTPILILIDESQRHSLLQLYNKYDGNEPFIFGDKNALQDNQIRSIKTDAPYLADKLMDYKKEVWNDALTFLGINNIMIDKKERLITDEANSNNELINLNLQSYLASRKLACKQFNEKFGFTGTDKEIDVRVRSDLHNIIKNAQSIVQDFKEISDLENDTKFLEKSEVE